MTVQAWDDRVCQGAQTFILDYSLVEQILFDDAIFDSVDEEAFSSTGGLNHDAFDAGMGTRFPMDDLVIA